MLNDLSGGRGACGEICDTGFDMTPSPGNTFTDNELLENDILALKRKKKVQ